MVDNQLKISYGIALCRYNIQKNNRVEILMIKKRYSYHFFNFVFGRYKINDKKYIQYLFNNMSFAEKIDIIGMRFEHMWYRIWLSNPLKHFDIYDIYEFNKSGNSTGTGKAVNSENSSKSGLSNAEKYKLFFAKKSKFEKNFMIDGGKKIKNLVTNSKDVEISWEIPKGGKIENETNIDCAIREFKEETLISSNKYKILYNIPPIIQTTVDKNITYQHCYYIAEVNRNTIITPKINFNNFDQISEIEQVKWLSISELDSVKTSEAEKNSIIKLTKKIIHLFKLHNKSNNKKLSY